MPNYMEYRKSISRELLAVKDRVRNLIDDRHWGEDGRYKEVVLMQTLRNHLPDTVRVGSGFAICGDDLTTQIDIIVYSSAVQPFFSTGDFVIVEKSGVLGIIEVKTRLNKADVAEVVEKAHKNGDLIKKPIFNGIFAYESDISSNDNGLQGNMKDALAQHKGRVNNIAFGKNIFAKYWKAKSLDQNLNEHISFYDLSELAFGYFISNLAEDVSGKTMTAERQKFYYPVDGGKEQRRIPAFDIPLENRGGNTNANLNR